MKPTVYCFGHVQFSTLLTGIPEVLSIVAKVRNAEYKATSAPVT